jgi:hypothetical protein
MKQLPSFSFIAKLTPRNAILTALVLIVLAVVAAKCGMNNEEALERYLELRESISAKDKGKRWREVDDLLNRRVNASTRLLKKKITLNVDKAITDYKQKEERPVAMRSPIVLQKARELGGTQQLVLEQAIYYELDNGAMGIRGAWTKPWPNEIVTVQPGLKPAQ